MRDFNNSSPSENKLHDSMPTQRIDTKWTPSSPEQVHLSIELLKGNLNDRTIKHTDSVIDIKKELLPALERGGLTLEQIGYTLEELLALERDCLEAQMKLANIALNQSLIKTPNREIHKSFTDLITIIQSRLDRLDKEAN